MGEQKITIKKEEILKIERKVSRDLEIASGNRINHKRVWKSKKDYQRKAKHKKNWA